MKAYKMAGQLPVMVVLLLLLGVACGPVSGDVAEIQEESATTQITAEDREPTNNLQSTSPVDTPLPPTEPAEETFDLVVDRANDPAEYDANGVEVGFTEDGHPYRGNPQAKVVLEEFSDFQCPYCSRFFSETLPSLEESQIANGELLLIFYDFPLSSIHPQATYAANAARCAGEQGAAAFWAMHDLIFSGLAQWSNANSSQTFEAYAEELDLNTEDFVSCLNSQKHLDGIQSDQEFGRSRGVSSTPTFFINDQLLVGAQPLTVFYQAIAAVREGQQIASDEQPAEEPSQPALKPTPANISVEQVAGRIGDTGAPVTIVEFTDYQCPYCQRHNLETMPQLIRDLVETGRVQYILKDFPLEQIHPEARLAAAAARCAGEQDSYWPMHDVLFAAQDEWGGQGQSASEIMTGLAEDLGLNANEFQDCLSSGRNDAAVQADLEEGLSLGVRGTPFFFVDGFPINGAQPYALFEYAVGLAEEGTLADAYTRPPEPTQQPTPTGPVEINTAGSYGLGNPDAPVTIVEYTDYQCPYCQRHFQQTFPNLKTNYIDEGIVRYVFKDFPLTGIHPQAFLAAEAARCAGDQGAYLEMHDALFDSQANWSGQSDAVGYFGALAGDIGLDAAAFASCLGNHAHEDAVTEDLEEGIGFGVNGTPAFFINGHFLSGAQPFSIFEQAIASLLSE